MMEPLSDPSEINESNNTLDYQKRVETLLQEDSWPDQEYHVTNDLIFKSNITDHMTLSSKQVKTILHRKVDSTWINASEAHLEAIRYGLRAAFLKGALDSNCLEDWAFQLDWLPNFLMRMEEFRTDYHKLRIEHAKQTMSLAARHLSETAAANKSTAKALKGQLSPSLMITSVKRMQKKH